MNICEKRNNPGSEPNNEFFYFANFFEFEENSFRKFRRKMFTLCKKRIASFRNSKNLQKSPILQNNFMLLEEHNANRFSQRIKIVRKTKKVQPLFMRSNAALTELS